MQILFILLHILLIRLCFTHCYVTVGLCVPTWCAYYIPNLVQGEAAFLTIAIALHIVPPKRRASPRQDVAKKSKHEDIVADVIKEIAPLIKSSIAEALDKHVPATSLDREDVTSDLPVLQNMFGDATMTNKGETNPFYLHVPSTTIAQIKEGRYVNLSELLHSDERDISLNVSNTGNVTVNKKSKLPKITNLEQWFGAFLLYCAIYTEQFPEEARPLFKYMASIHNMFKQFNADSAIRYDESFRQMRQLQPTHRWDVVHQELYLLAASRAVQSKPGGSGKNNQDQPFRRANPCPPGYCRQFNATGTCTWQNCAFRHSCFKCEGKHASKGCTSLQPTAATTKQSTIIKAKQPNSTHAN